MSKLFAAVFVLGLSSFALAQEESTEPRFKTHTLELREQDHLRRPEIVVLPQDADAAERDRVLEQLRSRKKQHVEAQDGDAELKARILEKVREKLAADRSALLTRIERIIDEELGKSTAKKPAPADGDSVQDIERKMRILEEEKEKLASDMAKAKRYAADAALREEAKKDGPHDAQEAQEMFENTLELHDKDKNYREAVKLFKRIYYNYPKSRIGSISAYNVACGYALAGSKEEAIDWLEYSIKGGYNDFDHLRKDSDLDSLRNEKRYKKLLTDR